MRNSTRWVLFLCFVEFPKYSYIDSTLVLEYNRINKKIHGKDASHE